jgi:hypothetical protein
MKNDPIIEEIRQYRREHAEQFGFNVEKIAEDLRKKQEKYKDRIVSYNPKLLLKKTNFFELSV